MMEPKDYIIESLEFYIKRLKTNSCTMEEMNAAARFLENESAVGGTIRDFAEFYGQSEQNVRTVISRKLIAKPKRKVIYPFNAFRKVVPDKWKKDK